MPVYVKKMHEGIFGIYWSVETSEGGFVDGLFRSEEEADAMIELHKDPLSAETKRAVWGDE